MVATAVAIGCGIHSAAVLSWYTVASGMVAVVVRVATVLLSGCNSSCNRLQYTQCCSTELVHAQLLIAWLQWLSGLQQYYLVVATAVAIGCSVQCYSSELVHS